MLISLPVGYINLESKIESSLFVEFSMLQNIALLSEKIAERERSEQDLTNASCCAA